MKIVFLVLFLLLLTILGWYWLKGFHNSTPSTLNSKDLIAPKRIQTVLEYVGQHGLDREYAFFINMKKESGSRRFYSVKLTTGELLNAGLVAHGRCNKAFLTGRQYGNEVGCGCTSLGRYKVGNAYQGRFGLAYKLHGLDATNSNAFKRYVVLHAHACVPYNEVAPAPICQSDGCPTVSPEFLQELKLVIVKAKKPMLLWIYED
jgi:hypothetical protein